MENADPLADELLRCMNAMCDDVDGVGDHVGSLNCILSVIGALSETVDVVRSRILAGELTSVCRVDYTMDSFLGRYCCTVGWLYCKKWTRMSMLELMS